MKEGESVTLRVAATGTEPLSYQRQLENMVMAVATNAVFEIASAQENDAGNYTVLVQNQASSVLSNPAVVTVEDASVISRTVSASRLGDLTAELLLEGPVGAKGMVEEALHEPLGGETLCGALINPNAVKRKERCTGNTRTSKSSRVSIAPCEQLRNPRRS